MNRLLLSFTICIVACTAAWADDSNDYKEFAEEIKQKVYAMDIPAFNVTEIPDKYRDESAVIIALYEGLTTEKKTGVKFELWIPSTRARIWSDRLTRMLVHINDRNALEQMSEFDFAMFNKKDWRNGLGYKEYEKEQRVLGARIIKPDGSVVEVSTDDFLDVEEGRKGEDKRRKLAIPGLEIGDNLDIFFFTSSQRQNLHLDPIRFTFRENYPVMYYKIHCDLDDDLTTQYRTLNGAPQFSTSRDDNGRYILDAEMTDIAAKTPSLWYNPVRQSPVIQMRVYNRRSDEYTPVSARKDGVQADPETKIIIGDAWQALETGTYTEKSMKDYLKITLKNGGKIFGKLKEAKKKDLMSDRETADFLYNLIGYAYFASGRNLNPYSFISNFVEAAKAAGLDARYGICTPDFNEPLDSLGSQDNSLWLGYIKDIDTIYLPPVGYFAPGEVPAIFQGEKARIMPDKKTLKKDKFNLGDEIALRASDPDYNRTTVSITAVPDGNTLIIDRDMRMTGGAKLSSMYLLCEEDIDSAYIRYLRKHEPIPFRFTENKKKAGERTERYADGRKRQYDRLKEEIAEYHGREAIDITDSGIISAGLDPDCPTLEYRMKYVMDGMTRKAGKNIIIPVGKLMNSQRGLLPSERLRSDDAHLPMARDLTYSITLKIPEGYTVSTSALNSLKRDVSTGAGSFKVNASSDNESIIINVSKRYDKKIVPASSWAQLTEIIDAAAQWEGTTLLLEQK